MNQEYKKLIDNIKASHSDSILSISFSTDGKYIASGSRDRSIKIWEVSTKKCVHTLNGVEGHSDNVWVILFSGDGKYIASGSSDGVKIWDSQNGKCIHTLEGHSDWIRRISFSTNDLFVVSESYDASLKIWEVNTGICMDTIKLDNEIERYVCLHLFHSNKLIAPRWTLYMMLIAGFPNQDLLDQSFLDNGRFSIN